MNPNSNPLSLYSTLCWFPYYGMWSLACLTMHGLGRDPENIFAGRSPVIPAFAGTEKCRTRKSYVLDQIRHGGAGIVQIPPTRSSMVLESKLDDIFCVAVFVHFTACHEKIPISDYMIANSCKHWYGDSSTSGWLERWLLPDGSTHPKIHLSIQCIGEGPAGKWPVFKSVIVQCVIQLMVISYVVSSDDFCADAKQNTGIVLCNLHSELIKTVL